MYNTKIIFSGDCIEIYKVNNYVIREDKKTEGSKIVDRMLKTDTKRIKDDAGIVNPIGREKTLNKAKNNIIRLIRSNPDMQTFITLTFANELDYKESKAKLNNFFTKLRKRYSGLKYLWVLEYGDKNNRLHYHVLCNIPIGIKLSSSKEKKSQDHKMLEQEFNNKYWRYGFVDIRHLKAEENTNVALYVSMYIVKNMKDKNLEGYRVYGYSHKTLNKPVEVKYYSKETVEDLIKNYCNYKIKYQNNYDIGFTDWKREHKGNVTYIELIKNKGEE